MDHSVPPIGLTEKLDLLEERLITLKRRRAQLEGDRHRLDEARRRGEVVATALVENRDALHAVARQIEASEREAAILEDQLAVDGRSDRSRADSDLITSLNVSAELDRVRAQIIAALRELAGPLARYHHFAERQRALSARIAASTGTDTSYATHIDTALLRESDFDADLDFVVTTLRRTRIVA